MTQPPQPPPPDEQPSGQPSGQPGEPTRNLPPLPGQYLPPQSPPGGPPAPPPGYGPPPPAPPKKRTGLIVGAVVGALVLIAGAVLAVLLITGSDEDSDDDEATDASSSAESTEPTEPTEATEAPTGDVLQGTGYTYVLPDQWRDITAVVEPQDTAGTIDTASAPGESLETTFANLIVESGPANGQTDLESARDQVAKNLETTVGVAPVETEGPTLDGVETAGLQLTQSNGAGIEVLQDAYVALRDDTYYVIGFSRDASKTEFEADLEQILDSWSWE